jgi:hypothetical protein
MCRKIGVSERKPDKKTLYRTLRLEKCAALANIYREGGLAFQARP